MTRSSWASGSCSCESNLTGVLLSAVVCPDSLLYRYGRLGALLEVDELAEMDADVDDATPPLTPAGTSGSAKRPR